MSRILINHYREDIKDAMEGTGLMKLGREHWQPLIRVFHPCDPEYSGYKLTSGYNIVANPLTWKHPASDAFSNTMVKLPIWCHEDNIHEAVRNYLAEFIRQADEFKRNPNNWRQKAEQEMKIARERGTGYNSWCYRITDSEANRMASPVPGPSHPRNLEVQRQTHTNLEPSFRLPGGNMSLDVPKGEWEQYSKKYSLSSPSAQSRSHGSASGSPHAARPSRHQR